MTPDPYLLALAVYRFPDGDTGDERKMVRFYASWELRRMARQSAEVAWTLPDST